MMTVPSLPSGGNSSHETELEDENGYANSSLEIRNGSDLIKTLGATLEQHKNSGPVSQDGPNLCVVLNAKAIRALSQAMDQTCDRFGERTGELEEQVAARTASLEHMSHRLELIIDSISDGIVTYDVLGHIESCNRAAREILELGGQVLTGAEIQSIFQSSLCTTTASMDAREIDLLLPSGSVARLEIEVQPIANSSNHARMMRIRDLTDVKHTERRLNEQAFLIDNVQAFVMASSNEKGVEWCNPHLELVTGYTKDELIGTFAQDLIIRDVTPPKNLMTLIDAVREERYYSVELAVRHKTGRPVWVQIEGHPIFSDDGSLDRFISMGVDITERKRQEKMQSDFCSMVSHELRTPLTVVSGSLDAMLAGLTGELPEAATELLHMGRRNCSQLSVLIEDILDINKLESGVVGFESENISIRGPLQDSIGSTMPLVNDTGLSLKTEFSPVPDGVFADPQRLRQVFTNLLSNAIKFSRPASELVVGVQPGPTGVRAYVRDQGPGIPLEFQEHLFKRFSRDVAVQASGKEGFGLGLCISKGLIEQMGGSIGYDTTENVGTTFYIDMPLSSVGSSNLPVPIKQAEHGDALRGEPVVVGDS